MSETKEVRYTARSITPPKRRSHSRSSSRSIDRSRSPEARNPGNNLYVTGLSTRVMDRDLEKYFSKEGKVIDCHIVVDPRTRESRGFAFVTMDTMKDAERCIKYLDRTVLEGRLITVEKAKRNRERTPTPGKYCGLRGQTRMRSRSPPQRRSRSPSPRWHRRKERDHHRSRSRSRSRVRRDRSRSLGARDASRRRRARSVSPYGK